MSLGVSRALVAAACLAGLAACESSTKTSSPFRPAGSPETTASTAEPATPDAASATPGLTASAPDVTGSVYVAPPPRPRELWPPGPGPWSAAEDPNDDLSLGKRQFREGNYGLAEMHFRRVVEQDSVPAQRKAEAWVGLAASYDRLKRFELADRAYAAAIAILGATPEILNNQGFSYMLRGDYPRARAKLAEALEKDPTNPYIQNNIVLLEKSIRGGGGRKKV
jgi:tetratricopeptide (TPR) repeat protein